MFKKTKNSNLFLFFLIGCFFVNFYGFCFALEVEYPTLSTGNAITSSSSVPEYLEYVFHWGVTLGFSIAVLSLVVAGILYILSSANPNWKAAAMDRAYGAITGLILLSLIYLIIATINPELAIFQIGKLEPVEPAGTSSQQPPPAPGVYLYAKEDCDSTLSENITGSSKDLGDLKNRVRSAKIVQGETIAYIAILHDIINFQGFCQYITPNGSCNPTLWQGGPFAASLSVYSYNFNPSKGSITFYRKPFYGGSDGSDEGNKKSGGYYKVGGAETKNNKFIKALDDKDLTFKDVPEEEQDCLKWEKDGKICKKENRKPPSLAGENISSIKIDGNYIVILLNYKPSKTEDPHQWPACQIYPTLDDKNKKGPQQIKWDFIRNQENLPNYVIIIPVG